MACRRASVPPGVRLGSGLGLCICRNCRPDPRPLVLACALVLLPAVARGQQFLANVTGTVTDVQGAVVPGVTVTVLNTDTNVSTEAQTNVRGAYTVQQLTPGPYRITAGLSGFKTFVRDGVTLRTAETVTVKLVLAGAAVAGTGTINAATSHVESNETTNAPT